LKGDAIWASESDAAHGSERAVNERHSSAKARSRTALYRIGGRSQNIDFGDVSFDRRSPSSLRCLLTRTICGTHPSPGAVCSQWLRWRRSESAGQRATSTGQITPVCQLPPPGRTTCVRYVTSLVGPSGTFVRVIKCVYTRLDIPTGHGIVVCATKYVKFFLVLFSKNSGQISDLPVSSQPGCRCDVSFKLWLHLTKCLLCTADIGSEHKHTMSGSFRCQCGRPYCRLTALNRDVC